MLVIAAVLDILRKRSQDSEEMEMQTHGASRPTSVGLLPSIASPLLPATVVSLVEPSSIFSSEGSWEYILIGLTLLGYSFLLASVLAKKWVVNSIRANETGEDFAEVSEKEKQESFHCLKFAEDALPAGLEWESGSRWAALRLEDPKGNPAQVQGWRWGSEVRGGENPCPRHWAPGHAMPWIVSFILLGAVLVHFFCYFLHKSVR